MNFQFAGEQPMIGKEGTVVGFVRSYQVLVKGEERRALAAAEDEQGLVALKLDKTK